MRVLFAGGGTGGHLFPALAIAGEVRRIDSASEIEFVGTRYGLEYRMKDQLNYPLSTIAIRGLARTLSLSLLAFPIRLIYSLCQSLGIVRRFRPDIVVGTGGYVSGPVILAAAIRGIPRVMQEQNSYPGLVTRRMANKATMVFVAYKRAAEYLPPSANIKFCGNPIRGGINGGDRAAALAKFGLRADRTTILILGGSQGARRLNEAVLGALKSLDSSIQLLWQCGKRDYTDVAARLDKMDVAVSLFPFCNEMELVYAAADLAIARAGALTLAELTACGLPAILVPFPAATADHQTHNAAEMVSAGAAEIIPESSLSGIDLIARAVDLIQSGRLPQMAEASRRLGRPHAAAEIAQELFTLAGHKGDMSDNQGIGPHH